MANELIGYIRKTKDNKIKINIVKDKIKNANGYIARDGNEFYSVYADFDKVKKLIEGERDYTVVEI